MDTVVSIGIPVLSFLFGWFVVGTILDWAKEKDHPTIVVARVLLGGLIGLLIILVVVTIAGW